MPELSLGRKPIRVIDVYNLDRAAKELHSRRAELLNQTGRYENKIVCTEGPAVEPLRDRGLQVITLPVARDISPRNMLPCIRRLTEVFRDERPTIVHSHGSTAGACARLAARRAEVPYVVHTVHGFHFHERMGPLRRSIYVAAERFLAHYTDVLLFQNEEDLQDSVRLGIWASRYNLKVGNGIDLRHHQPLRLRAPAEPPMILCVARFEPVKNQQMLLRAARLLRDRGLEFQLCFAGSGVTMDDCRRLADELGVGDRVRFLGYVDDVQPLIAEACVAVLTSVKEGIPRALLEPMAAGLPVVATDVKGNRETICHDQTGLLVPLDDDRALADALERVITDDAYRERLGENAVEWVHEHFDETTVVDRLIEVYDSLVFPMAEHSWLSSDRVAVPNQGVLPATRQLEQLADARPETMTLRQIKEYCHGMKSAQPRWHYLHRLISLPITWLCCRLPVSPNQVSATMLVLALGAAAALVPLDVRINLLGIALFYVAFLLDKVDGDLARLRRRESPRGMVLDFAYHRLSIFAFFGGMGLHYYGLTQDVVGLAAAFVSGFLANYLQDAQVYPYRLYSLFVLSKRESWRIRALPENRRLVRRELWFKPLKLFKSEPFLLAAAVVTYGWPALLQPFFFTAAAGLATFVVLQHFVLYHDGTEAEMSHIHLAGTAPSPRASVSEDHLRARHDVPGPLETTPAPRSGS